MAELEATKKNPIIFFLSKFYLQFSHICWLTQASAEWHKLNATQPPQQQQSQRKFASATDEHKRNVDKYVLAREQFAARFSEASEAFEQFDSAHLSRMRTLLGDYLSLVKQLNVSRQRTHQECGERLTAHACTVDGLIDTFLADKRSAMIAAAATAAATAASSAGDAGLDLLDVASVATGTADMLDMANNNNNNVYGSISSFDHFGQNIIINSAIYGGVGATGNSGRQSYAGTTGGGGGGGGSVRSVGAVSNCSQSSSSSSNKKKNLDASSRPQTPTNEANNNNNKRKNSETTPSKRFSLFGIDFRGFSVSKSDKAGKIVAESSNSTTTPPPANPNTNGDTTMADSLHKELDKTFELQLLHLSHLQESATSAALVAAAKQTHHQQEQEQEQEQQQRPELTRSESVATTTDADAVDTNQTQLSDSKAQRTPLSSMCDFVNEHFAAALDTAVVDINNNNNSSEPAK